MTNNILRWVTGHKVSITFSYVQIYNYEINTLGIVQNYKSEHPSQLMNNEQIFIVMNGISVIINKVVRQKL